MPQAFKIVSLSISDGGPADEPFSTLSCLDTARWFPAFPFPNLTLLGADCTDDRMFHPECPITLSLFYGPGQDLRRIAGIVVLSDDAGLMWSIEFSYPSGTSPVRLGVDDVVADETARFDFDCANGEYIRGMKTYYKRRGEFLGFKVNIATAHKEFAHATNIGDSSSCIRARGARSRSHPSPRMTFRWRNSMPSLYFQRMGALLRYAPGWYVPPVCTICRLM